MTERNQTTTSVVICRHGKPEVYCTICDLEARVKLRDAVAMATMAERERCAKIAEQENSGCDHVWESCSCADKLGDVIAARIRSGE